MFNVSNFVSSINNDGVVRTNKFKTTFALPPSIVGKIGGTQSILDFFGINASIPEQVIGGAADLIIGSGNVLSLRCEGAQLPGMSLASVDGMPRFGYGANEEMPYAPIFDKMTLTYLLERDSKIHKIFYDWTNSIVNYHSQGQSRMSNSTVDNRGPVVGMSAYEVGYKDDYATDIEVWVYDTNDIPIMKATAYRAHPTSIPPIDLNWGSTNDVVRLTIPFAFTDFEYKYFRDLTRYGVPDDVANVINILDPLVDINPPNPLSLLNNIF